MKSLDEIRSEIDAIDSQLLDLLTERVGLVHLVGEFKKQHGLQIYAPEREKALLERLRALNNGRLPDQSLQAIFREIMSMALALEDDLKIAFLGPEGSWSHQAAIKRFGASVKYMPCANFAEVFDTVARRRADYGVVPIENSAEGAVSPTLDQFVDSPLSICAQIMLRIENCLLANCPRNEIVTLYSHPQVFGQCRDWILRHFPDTELVECSSTTKAARLAKLNSAQGAAALGGKLAAELNGLAVLEESIQDRATNTTRFLVIGEKSSPQTGDDRTSILFTIKDQPGSLVEALRSFEKFRVNMSKIESRPSRKKEWEYVFYVDLAGHANDENLKTAISDLEKHCSFVKILGSYPA